MSLKKFGQSDVIKNVMRAYPHNSFRIYSSTVYYDNRPIESGSFDDDILSASGGLSLFEYNVDRAGSTRFETEFVGADSTPMRTKLVTSDYLNPPIIPYVTKGSSKVYLKASSRVRTITEGPDETRTILVGGMMQDVSDDYSREDPGSALTGSTYAATASITRELMTNAGDLNAFLTARGQFYAGLGAVGASALAAAKNDKNNEFRDEFYYLNAFGDLQGRPSHRHYYGLRNSLNFYGTRSPHYFVEYSASVTGQWNKDQQDINLISIPKIFYGSRIKPGSMSLKFYITGTLVGELQDTKYNGELIQVGPPGSNGSGSVAGVAMYEEGFALLTGSWKLTAEAFDFAGSGGDPRIDFITGSWLYFAAGANDGIGGSTVAAATTSASFDMSFKGHTENPVMTLYAHARRGEVNFSNNPTFLDYEDAQNKILLTSSNVYLQKDDIRIKNTVSSSYAGHTADFERQVYISRVAVYDDDKKLIGIATLSSPVLKKEAQDLSFKLKLDL